ncbi:hypothetical protein ANCCAN_04713 [Ancylostoma caninum]|uniref:Uncharacterized protein n=1 Tax=Ancylostoma caninum TaxID=29170 RepID=A0A368GXR2_ANCCA|nr:hypothetical protein ANCCAN_04713 [Ancylostoma caninum]
MSRIYSWSKRRCGKERSSLKVIRTSFTYYRVISDDNLYCAFKLDSSCEKNVSSFIEALSWSPNRQSERCHINTRQTLMCACYQDLCSSNYKYIMEVWKASDGYSKDHMFTRCLRKLIETHKSTPEKFRQNSEGPVAGGPMDGEIPSTEAPAALKNGGSSPQKRSASNFKCQQ